MLKPSGKIYQGYRDSRGTAHVVIVENGITRALDPRFDIRNHSPTGLEWGYGGSGPAQLALAILADATDSNHAAAHYQWFKTEIIQKLDRDSFEMDAAWPAKLTSYRG